MYRVSLRSPARALTLPVVTLTESASNVASGNPIATITSPRRVGARRKTRGFSRSGALTFTNAKSFVASILGSEASPLPFTSMRLHSWTTCAFVSNQPSAVTANPVPEDVGLAARHVEATTAEKTVVRTTRDTDGILESPAPRLEPCACAFQPYLAIKLNLTNYIAPSRPTFRHSDPLTPAP